MHTTKSKKPIWKDYTCSMIPTYIHFGKGKATVTKKDQWLPEVQGGGEKNE